MEKQDDPNYPNQPIPSSVVSSDEESLHPGLILKKRYLIEKELGRGGMAVVYRARDLELASRPVVIKVLLGEPGDMTEQDWLKKHFSQEIKVLSQLNHPGVVGALDAGVTPDKRQYLVMEFVEGVNMRSVMGRMGMDFDRIVSIMSQIGAALSAAHNKGVLHRDLKPENIMLQKDEDEEYVKLIDFGIASIRDSEGATSRMTSVAGT